MTRMSRDPDPHRTELLELVHSSRCVLALTGAGCSTESGIPDYRDESGEWKRDPPIQFREFLRDGRARQRYWARSLVGWPIIAAARPNAAHRALARLETEGRINHVITQNVDGLHQRAGSRAVTDLHGQLHDVICLDCGARLDRAGLQDELASLNPHMTTRNAPLAPDGDADLQDIDYARFEVPDCRVCGGMLKPAVVFFGESVPRARVDDAVSHLEEADALLVVGSSLMVWSGYRFARLARERGLPIAIVNRGRTRADDLASVRVRASCGEVLALLADELCAGDVESSCDPVTRQ
jgi:NAD-dependent SIR2 family protein deacetylase